MPDYKETQAITRHQIRAARAMLNWSGAKLAERAEIGLATLRMFESGQRVPNKHTKRAIVETLKRAGIRFIGTNGVMLR